MIRLSTQFDDPRTLAAMASPKSHACSSCSCCCCVVSTIGTSVLTARSLRGLPVIETGTPEDDLAASREDARHRAARWLAFLLLPGSMAVGALLVPLPDLARPALAAALWLGGLGWLVRSGRLKLGRAFLLIALFAAATAAEVFLWISALF